MSVMELLTTRRTYRRFAQKAVPQDVVNDIVQAVRLSSCGANRQAVRLVLVQSPEMVAKVQPVQFHGIAVRAVLVELDAGLEVFQILADTPYQVVVLLYLLRDLLQIGRAHV